MDNLQTKLCHLKWLKSVGIDYYCSAQKDRKNSLISELKTKKANSIQRNDESIMRNQKTQEKDVIKTETKDQVIIESKSNLENHQSVQKARKLADESSTLEELRKNIEDFDSCELKNFAINTVFSDGVQNAPILVVGEAPGATEDEMGIPFCGESGQLLDKMLGTIGISREKNAYITNTIFWRPPANRRPTDLEIETCKPFVEKHIALIKPKLIILCGNTAVTSLLGKQAAISYIRKNYYLYTNKYLSENINCTAIFHPAYLLRQPSQKKSTWYDLLKIQEFLEGKL